VTIPLAVTSLRAIKVRPGHRAELPEHVVTEEPLEIRLAGPGQEPAAVVVTMRTPGNDFELAAGFACTEGLAIPGEIAGVGYCDAVRDDPELRYNTVTVSLRREWVPPDRSRPFGATASCGVCGKASIEDVAVACDAVGPAPAVPGSAVVAMPDLLRGAQRAFDRTGGLHAAGLFEGSGELLCAREDVGRHNAVDKVIGNRVLHHASASDTADVVAGGKASLAGCALMVSGRVSFEIVQKAAVAGIGAICAVSAPSSLAVQAAKQLGIGLAGFVRGGSYNIYSHPERFDLDR
jgi:FdhD protein